jgi:peptidyl-prolyl cis-trans isomerase B (cyclophilin B)
LNNRIFVVFVGFLLASLLAACSSSLSSNTPTAVPKAVVSPTPAERPEEAVAPPQAPAADSRQAVPVPPADGSRPLAKLSPAERADRFSGPAPMSIEPGKIYVATIVTAKGNIVAELYSDTPESTNNFVTLARNGFYDGLTFHRVESDFVIQGGDPQGAGTGGPGYTIPAEIKHDHPRGALAWARTDDQVNPERRSSGSQFYLTLKATPFLNGAYTVFGYVIEGMEVADKIAKGDVITRIDISEASVSRLPTPTPTPEPKAPTAEEGRPLAKLPAVRRENIYNAAPAMAIDAGKSYQATITSNKGEIVVDLDAVTAPVSVNNFVLLANLGFYDGLPVAFVQPGSHVVFGSPAARPDSDVGYTQALEPSANASRVVTGTISFYPVAGQEQGEVRASGSQFLISLIEIPNPGTPLNIFGVVTSGMDIVAKLQPGDLITSITIAGK